MSGFTGWPTANAAFCKPRQQSLQAFPKLAHGTRSWWTRFFETSTTSDDAGALMRAVQSIRHRTSGKRYRRYFWKELGSVSRTDGDSSVNTY
jgi:hypothetical protein